MKFNIRAVVLGLALLLSTAVQAKAHSVALSFTKSTDDTGAAGSGYTTYRLTGTCPASVTSVSGFTALNTTLFQGSTYTDATVIPGNYCYVITFTAGGASSGPSNTAGASILPAAPTNVTVSSSN